MAYGTPRYDYEQARSGLAERKGLEDVGRDYGRFMSQERFRRRDMDQNTRFKDGFPKVGSHFSQRGMWNSGLRSQGQNRFAQDFQEAQSRTRFDQASENAQFDMGQTSSDAAYQRALLQLFERMKAQSASGFNPFQGLK